MRRLYLRIYLGFLAMLAALLAASSLFWWQGPGPRRDRELLRATGILVEAALPAAGAPPDDARRVLARLAGDRKSVV